MAACKVPNNFMGDSLLELSKLGANRFLPGDGCCGVENAPPVT